MNYLLRFFLGTFLIASVSPSFAYENNRTIGRDGVPLETDESGEVKFGWTTLLIEANQECEIDTVTPVASCVDSRVFSTGPFSCDAIVLATALDAGSFDACSSALDFRISLTDTSTASPVELPHSLDLGLGDYNVTLWVIDEAGNWSTCATTISVLDLVSPVAVCADVPTISLNDHGEFILYATDVDEGSWDNCSSVALSIESGTASTSPPTSNSVTFTEPGTKTVFLWAVDENGNSNNCWLNLVVIETTTSTSSPNVLDSFPLHIYPNPFWVGFTIETDSEQYYRLQIRGLDGGLIYSKEQAGKEHSVDLKGFADGLYVLRLELEGKIVTRKLVKSSN